MIIFIAAIVLIGTLIMVSAILLCSVIFDTTKNEQQSEQIEQSEQETQEPERPNVFCSKDIKIISEPRYLLPPFRFDTKTTQTIQWVQDDEVVFCFLFEENSISILIKDINLYKEVVSCQLIESKNIIVRYLLDKNILK